MKIEVDIDFIKKWNKAFSEYFKWEIDNRSLIRSKLNFMKYKIILPWHPLFFRSDLENILENKNFSFLNKLNNI